MVHYNFYSHIDSYEHLYRIHMKSQKRESDFRHRLGCPVTLISPLGIHVCTNPDTLPCHSTQTCLIRQFVFSPFISLRVYKDHIFLYIKISSGGRGLLPALGSRSLKLQASGACYSISLQRAFRLLPALGTESFVAFK